jgi:hypothetical protein
MNDPDEPTQELRKLLNMDNMVPGPWYSKPTWYRYLSVAILYPIAWLQMVYWFARWILVSGCAMYSDDEFYDELPTYRYVHFALAMSWLTIKGGLEYKIGRYYSYRPTQDRGAPPASQS